MQTVNVTAEKRENTGKSANKALRKSGLIPAVLYGGSETKTLAVTHNAIKSLIYTPDFKVAKLETADGAFDCFIKDIQFHPVTDEIVHVDFLEIGGDRKVKVDIPIRTKGVSPGVKGGGKLVFNRRKVTIMCLPADMVDELFVDISELELGFSVRVSDLEVTDKIKILTPMSIPIAGVEIPRALKSAEASLEAEGDAAAAPAEGEAGGDAAPAE